MNKPRPPLIRRITPAVDWTSARAVRTLLEIGYQVRFGVLNAAFYGVGQSRKRAFLLAALVNVLGIVGWLFVLPKIAPIRWSTADGR